MALTNKYYSLKNVRLTLNTGVVVDVTEIKIKRSWEKVARNAGSTLTEQTVILMEKMPEISIKGWNADNISFSTLTGWTGITALTLLSTETGTPSLLQTDFFTKWPVTGMSVGDIDTTINDKPSEWTAAIWAGVLNPSGV